MPKRIIDGEGVWRSKKLRQLPEELRRDYVWLLPLADSRGVFECEPEEIWADCYAYNLPSTTPERVAEILGELERVKLLFRWEQDGKTWGYWVGIEKPGRLPAPSQQFKHEKVGPLVPKAQLAEFTGTNPSGSGQVPNGYAPGTTVLVCANADAHANAHAQADADANADASADAATASASATVNDLHSNGNQHSHQASASQTDYDETVGMTAEEKARAKGERLAELFYSLLPPENQAAAISTWETAWGEDLMPLTRRVKEETLESMIRFALNPQYKWAKFTVRAIKFVENFDKIYADWKKVVKKVSA